MKQFSDFTFQARGSYLVTVWNVDHNAYGSTVYLMNTGGWYVSTQELGAGYTSHFSNTAAPTVALSHHNQHHLHFLQITNNDGDSKTFKYKVRVPHLHKFLSKPAHRLVACMLLNPHRGYNGWLLMLDAPLSPLPL